MIKPSSKHPILTAYYEAEETLLLKREQLALIQQQIHVLRERLVNLGDYTPVGVVARYEPSAGHGGGITDPTYETYLRLRADDEVRLQKKLVRESELLTVIDELDEEILPYLFAVSRLSDDVRQTLAIRFASNYTSTRHASVQVCVEESTVRERLDLAEAVVQQYAGRVPPKRIAHPFLPILPAIEPRICPAFTPQKPRISRASQPSLLL